jgi:hypothetical protein
MDFPWMYGTAAWCSAICAAACLRRYGGARPSTAWTCASTAAATPVPRTPSGVGPQGRRAGAPHRHPEGLPAGAPAALWSGSGALFRRHGTCCGWGWCSRRWSDICILCSPVSAVVRALPLRWAASWQCIPASALVHASSCSSCTWFATRYVSFASLCRRADLPIGREAFLFQEKSEVLFIFSIALCGMVFSPIGRTSHGCCAEQRTEWPRSAVQMRGNDDDHNIRCRSPSAG